MPGITGLTQTAVAALVPSTSGPVTQSRWHQPWSEPVRQRIGPQLAVALIASGLRFVEAPPFQETVTEDRWHQPWSEPVRTRWLPPAEQPALALQPAPGDPYGWFAPLAEPVRTRFLGVAHQQAFVSDPQPRVSFSWLNWLNEPVRIKSALLAGEQQVAPFDEDIIWADRWFAWWSEPIVKAKPRLAEALQQYLAFAPPFSAGAAQSEWAGPPPSLVRFQYQVEARSPWPDINIGWYLPLTEPVRIKPALLAALQSFEVRYDVLPLPFLGGGGGWYLPDPTRPPDAHGEPERRNPRALRPGGRAPRQVEAKTEPPTFAETIAAQQPARLADVLGSAFAQRLGQLAPPALDLYLPPASAVAASAGKPAVPGSKSPGIAPAVIDDIQDRLDAMEALRVLDALEQQRREELVMLLLHLANSEQA
jgi:hypothetical protein